MHELYELKEKLCDELKEYNNKEMSKTNLEVTDKLAHTIKNLGKIIEMYDEEEGYSSMNGLNQGNSYAQSRSYRRNYGNSYARGKNARRDSMGRYSRDDGMIADLRELMDNAPDEKTRQEFERFISKIEKM
jgi:hypothetical protein